MRCELMIYWSKPDRCFIDEAQRSQKSKEFVEKGAAVYAKA